MAILNYTVNLNCIKTVLLQLHGHNKKEIQRNEMEECNRLSVKSDP